VSLTLLLGGCYGTSTVYRGADADALQGRTVVMLESTRLPPFSADGYEKIVARVERALASSPDIPRLISRKDMKERGDIPLATRNNYKLLSNSISLLGVVNPELSSRLGLDLNAQLLSSIHLSFLPCSACEEGDQLWMVGQVVSAGTGKVLLRTHHGVPVESSDEAQLLEVAEELAANFLLEAKSAFHRKWHRQRFEHLRPAS